MRTTWNDTENAKALAAAVDTLNAAITEAAQTGLRVAVDVYTKAARGSVEQPIVSVSVVRPIELGRNTRSMGKR